ncbi:alginate lyase family protein [Candidatus Poribacteria bacterium]|nr:alginate lyase family protein [Candidatus Poribacteria bacterium]
MKNEDTKLRSLKPEEILTKLNLERPELAAIKVAADCGDRLDALASLRNYYRGKYPLPKIARNTKRSSDIADKIVQHVFQWGPYEAASYGKEMDWEWDPRGDIEWVAAIYRFYWANPLADAFAATQDEKYARAFVELTSDWIAKHPLENHEKTHPVYTSWRGFAWLDIQTGIRATQLCTVFRTLVHAEAFTPEFLGVLLASLYDHQTKTEKIPMGVVHNKAVFEQRGFVNVAFTFREFKDSVRWMELALGRTRENLLAQTTSDGVQREWSGGYHLGVLRDAVEIMERMESMEIEVPADYRERVQKMYDYIFAIATPDLGFPMFGDCGRPIRDSGDRSRLPLYSTLLGATELLGDVKYAARAKLARTNLPKQKSYAFAEAGMYVMRNDWGAEQIYFALHCSPPAISGHDQPDNGTFELYAYGRWLMPDTGFYTYGHDPDGRAWHRQTRVHQTLTLDGQDSTEAPKQRLWQTSSRFDVLTVENRSYTNLIHRRTVWFVDKSFFVLLDEAIGHVAGELSLHFQLAPGDAQINLEEKWARTTFEDANILVWTEAKSPVSLHEEEGWFAWEYGSRQPRKAFRYQHEKTAPAAFLTLLVPYRGREVPTVSATLREEFEVGADRVALEVEVFGKCWRIGRDLEQQRAWCEEG